MSRIYIKNDKHVLKSGIFQTKAYAYKSLIHFYFKLKYKFDINVQKCISINCVKFFCYNQVLYVYRLWCRFYLIRKIHNNSKLILSFNLFFNQWKTKLRKWENVTIDVIATCHCKIKQKQQNFSALSNILFIYSLLK